MAATVATLSTGPDAERPPAMGVVRRGGRCGPPDQTATDDIVDVTSAVDGVGPSDLAPARASDRVIGGDLEGCGRSDLGSGKPNPAPQGHPR